MKKTPKTLLSLVLALVLALGCLSGIAANAEELEQATIKVWQFGPGPQKDSEAVFAKFNEILPNYLPNTTVDFLQVAPGEYAEKWSKAMAAQEQIDAAWFGYKLNLQDELAMGSLTPLNDLVAAYGQDMVASLGQGTLDALKVDDVLYYVPCWQAEGALSIQGIYLRRDILDVLPNQNYFDEFYEVQRQIAQMGYMDKEAQKMIYDKLEEYIKGAKEAGIESTGFEDQTGRAFGPSAFGDGLAGTIYWGDDTFTLHSKYITGSEAAEIELYRMERNNDFWKKGYYRSDLLSAEATGYSAGKAPADVPALSGHGASGYVRELYSDEEIHAGISRVVGIDVKMVQTADVNIASTTASTATCIPYTAKNPERAMMYINLMNSPKGAELYQTMVYGLEGQHYNRVDDTYIEIVGGTGQATSDWAYGQWKWAIGSCVNTLTQVGEDPEYWAKMAKLEAQAVVNPMGNFVIDWTNIDIERMNCQAIIGEYENLFVYDDYAERVQERNDKMMAAGYDVLLKEVQAQLDAYLETVEDKSWPVLYK